MSLKVFLVGLGSAKRVTRSTGPSFSHGREDRPTARSTYLNLPSTAGQSLLGPAALPVSTTRVIHVYTEKRTHTRTYVPLLPLSPRAWDHPTTFATDQVQGGT